MVKYFIDTNMMWWYLIDTSKNHLIVKPYINQLIQKHGTILIANEYVAIELIHLLIKKKGKEGYRIAKLLLDGKFSSIFEIKFNILKILDLQKILDYLTKYGYKTSIGGRDSSILHLMETLDIKYIITNDKDFTKVSSIEVLNPLFKEN